MNNPWARLFILLLLSFFDSLLGMQKPQQNVQSKTSGAATANLSLAERKNLFRSAAEKPSPVPIATPAQNQSFLRKFEFSNQSDQYVTVWIPTSQGCWQPTLLYPYTDSGILNPIEGGTIYIYTKATGHFIMQMGLHDSYRLINETPSRETKGHSKVNIIKHMPYDQVKDVVVVISPDGSVDFTKRNL